jgi:hypothetical protein
MRFGGRKRDDLKPCARRRCSSSLGSRAERPHRAGGIPPRGGRTKKGHENLLKFFVPFVPFVVKEG